MELTEPIEVINKRLADLFGIDTASSRPMWRITWGDEEFEWRFGEYEDITSFGVYLRTVVETRLVPKYRQWAPHMYILERLVSVPVNQQKEIPEIQTSYEPLWTFRDKNDNPIPPKWEAIQLIISVILSVQHKDNRFIKRYFDPDGENTEEVLVAQKKRIDNIIEELFGEQSSLQGTTYATGESIIVPRNFERIH